MGQTFIQATKRTLKGYLEWLAPAAVLIFVTVYFKEDIGNYLMGISSHPVKIIMLSIIFGLCIISGMVIAVYLLRQKVDFTNIFKRLGLMIVLFLMAWGVNATQAIFAV